MDLKNFKFTEEHEWVNVDGDAAAVGVTDYAQKELGDVVYVELPSVGDTVEKGDACSNIESVKAVSDIYSPLSGEIVEVNESLEDAPETINKDPYGGGWIFKIKMDDTGQLDDLMDHAKYEEYLKSLKDE
jgi:glycine cleavage system H protein